MKRLSILMLMLPLAACITEDDDENTQVEITGSLQSSDVTIYSGMANAGLVAGTESQQTFDEALNAKEDADNAVDQQPLSLNRNRASNSRALIVEPQPCDQSGTASVDLTEGVVTVDFDACTGPDGGSLDGAVAYKGESLTVQQNLFSIGASVEYLDLRAQSPIQSVYAELDGKINVELTITNVDWEYSLSSSAFDYEDPNHNFLLNNFNFSLTGEISNEEQVPASWTYDYHVTNNEGTFYVNSQGPITLINANSEKRNGTILVEGVNALLTITLDGDAEQESNEVLFSLDIDKNGSEDVTASMSQATFYGWEN